jgi:hypothetical protein
MTTTTTALSFVRTQAFGHGRAGLTLAATLARIADDTGMVLVEEDYDDAIAGHAEGSRTRSRQRKARAAR